MILRLLILGLLLIPSFADAVSFRAATHGDQTPGTTCVTSVPSGTTDGDLLLAVATAHQESPDGTITAPSGWTEVATHYNAEFGRVSVFSKIASSESGSYTWTSSVNVRFACTTVAYYDGIHSSSPIEAVTNTAYVANGTVFRAAGVTTTATRSLIFVGVSASNPPSTATPPTSPDTFTEDVDYGNNRRQRYFAHLDWGSSGSTGNVDAVSSEALTAKHAFLLVLTPADSGGGGPLLLFRRRH